MSKKITLQLAAFSDAAGKADPAAPLGGNEDNFYVDSDLSSPTTASFTTDAEFAAGDCGCLLAVADGMGGLNAGEVASALAVETISRMMRPENIDRKKVENAGYRARLMEKVTAEADRVIKTEARRRAEHDGMGSTLIMAWIYGGEVTVTWCGDSRAYLFSAGGGLQPISTDHSYVQSLANAGVITYEETFGHPQGNIVTRSLGDPNKAARGQSVTVPLADGDIVLLCSDGLSGVLRDRPTLDADGKPLGDANIEDIVRDGGSLAEIRQRLWTAAEASGWYDNVTVVMARIVAGAGMIERTPAPLPKLPMRTPADATAQDGSMQGMDNNRTLTSQSKKSPTARKHKVLIWIAAVALALAAAALLARALMSDNPADDSYDHSQPAMPADDTEGVTVHATSIDDTAGENPATQPSDSRRQHNSPTGHPDARAADRQASPAAGQGEAGVPADNNPTNATAEPEPDYHHNAGDKTKSNPDKVKTAPAAPKINDKPDAPKIPDKH